MSYQNLPNGVGQCATNSSGNVRGSFLLYDLLTQGGHVESKSPGHQPKLAKAYSNSTLPTISSLLPTGQPIPNTRYSGVNSTVTQISQQQTVGPTSRLQTNNIMIPVMSSDKIPKRTISIKTEADRSLRTSIQPTDSNITNPTAVMKKAIDGMNENSNPMNLGGSHEKVMTPSDSVKKITSDAACQVDGSSDQISRQAEIVQRSLEKVECERSELIGLLDKVKGQTQALTVDKIRLERLIDSERNEKEDLIVENKTLRSEVEALSQKIQKLEGEKISLKDSCDKLQANADETKAEILAQKNEIEKLLDTLKSTKEELDMKGSQLQDEQNDAAAARELIVNLKGENEQMLTEVSMAYEAKLKELHDEMESLQRELNLFRNISTEKIFEVEKKISVLVEEKEDLQTSLDHITIEKDMAVLELKHSKDLLAEMELELQESQKELSVIQDKLVGDMERTILLQMSLEEKIRLCELEVNDKDAALQQLKNQHETDVSDLTKEKEEVMRRNSLLEGNVSTLKEELSHLRKKYNDTVCEFEGLINEVTLELKGRDDMLNDRDNEMKELQESIQKYQEESAIFQEKIKQLEEENRGLEQKMEELVKLNNDAVLSAEEKVREITVRTQEEMASIREEFTKERKVMEKQLETTMQERVKANEKLGNLQRAKATLDKEVEGLREEKEKAEADLNEANQTLSAQQREFERKEGSLFTELDSLKKAQREKAETASQGTQTMMLNEDSASLTRKDHQFLCVAGLTCVLLSLLHPSYAPAILGSLAVLLASIRFFNLRISKQLSLSWKKIGISCLLVTIAAGCGVRHQIFLFGTFLSCFDSILCLISSRFEGNEISTTLLKAICFTFFYSCQQMFLNPGVTFKSCLMIFLGYITKTAIPLVRDISKNDWVKTHKPLFHFLISFGVSACMFSS